MADEIKIDIANEVADIDVVFNRIDEDPKGAVKAYTRIANNFKPRSIACLARDQIMQFPVYMSANVSADDASIISKSLEKQYSVLAMLALSNHLNYDSSKYQTVGDVISEIHNNNDSPNMLNYVLNLIDTTSDVVGTFESINKRVQVSSDDLAGLWYGTNDEITTESINNKYLPNEGKLCKAENAFSSALEASSKKPSNKFNSGKAFASLAYDSGNFMDSGNIAKKNRKLGSGQAFADYAANSDNFMDSGNKAKGNAIQDKAQKNVSSSGWDSHIGTSNMGVRGAAHPAKLPEPLLKNDQMLLNAAPTVITASMVIDGKPRDFMIAVKAMCHVVPSAQMVGMLIDAVQNNQLAFKIIKWSKGEQRFVRDFIFDISNARESAKNMKNAGAWTYALKRRKEASKAFVGGGAPVSPISTLVVTDVEVEAVKAACGIDISRDVVAAKLIKDYFLLAFMIYNTQTKAIMTMIDSDKSTGFITTNINGLKAGNKKDDGLDAKDLIKLLGR